MLNQLLKYTAMVDTGKVKRNGSCVILSKDQALLVGVKNPLNVKTDHLTPKQIYKDEMKISGKSILTSKRSSTRYSRPPKRQNENESISISI